MTDKKEKIIIDGTDVSECKHFKIGTCLADYLLTDMNFSEAKCELCKNCYYKQLKRKEQECEELKKECERLKNELSTYGATGICETCTEKSVLKCDQLEKENEKLKKKLQAQRNFTAQEQRKIYCVAYDKTCETGNECKQKKCVFKDSLKYKQTLTEIKEIVGIGLVDGLQPEEYSGFLKTLQAQILQKISEVEND